jgi:hypothetical protein
MEYKLVYRPYALATLVNLAQSQGDKFGGREAIDFSNMLNENAKEKWRVIECGTILSGNDAVFWALLERPEVVEGSVMTG